MACLTPVCGSSFHIVGSAIYASPAVTTSTSSTDSLRAGTRGCHAVKDGMAPLPLGCENGDFARWHLVPGAAVESPPAGFRGRAAPLLEEVRHPRRQACVAQLRGPRWVHRAGTRPRLAAGDNPSDAVEVEFVQRPEQRLAG